MDAVKSACRYRDGCRPEFAGHRRLEWEARREWQTRELCPAHPGMNVRNERFARASDHLVAAGAGEAPASTLILLQLLHSTIGVIDGAVGVSVCACVRVRDRQPAERFA